MKKAKSSPLQLDNEKPFLCLQSENKDTIQKSKSKIKYQKSFEIKELELKLLIQKQKKYPEIPSHLLAPITHEDKTANGLTKAIIAFVKLKGGQAERISSSGRVIKKGNSSLYIPGTSTNGTADISATIKGRSVKIEVKIGADRQSDAQKKYQSDVERAMGIYFIARNFSDFVKFFNTI